MAKVKVKVTQPCPTLCHQARILEWVTFPFSRGIFPPQGSNTGLPHCRLILYQMSHKGSTRILKWVAYPFSSGFPDPGIEPGSPAMHADSLPTELSRKLLSIVYIYQIFFTHSSVMSPQVAFINNDCMNIGMHVSFLSVCGNLCFPFQCVLQIFLMCVIFSFPLLVQQILSNSTSICVNISPKNHYKYSVNYISHRQPVNR